MLKKSELVKWWRMVHDRPAWLEILKRLLDLDTEDEKFLENFDYDHHARMKILERIWRQGLGLLPQPEVDEVFQKDCRQRFLKQQLASAIDEIKDSERAYQSMVEARINPTERLLMLDNVAELARIIARLEFELKVLDEGSDVKQLSEQQLARARAVPLESFLSSKNGYVLCPLHPDKNPSMLVKNGFGYCFVCNQSLDAIGFMMKVKGLSFKKAVEALC